MGPEIGSIVRSHFRNRLIGVPHRHTYRYRRTLDCEHMLRPLETGRRHFAERTMLKHSLPGDVRTGVHYDKLFVRGGDSVFLIARVPLGVRTFIHIAALSH